MTWIKFIYWLTGLYAFYYLLNILWDVLRTKRAGSVETTPELHFEEAVTPRTVTVTAPEPEKPEAGKKGKTDPVASAIGGVGLKDLFNLAKAELIAYNRAVTF